MLLRQNEVIDALLGIQRAKVDIQKIDRSVDFYFQNGLAVW